MLNRIRTWLPVLTALTANSPFWQGRDTGYASFRSQAWQRWPSAGADGGVRRRRRLPPADRRRPGDRHRPGLRDGLLRRPSVGELADGRGPGRRRRAARGGRGHAGRPRPRPGGDRRPRRPGRRGGAGVRSELLRLAAWRAGRSGVTGDLVHPRTGRPAPGRGGGGGAARRTSGRPWPTPATRSGSPTGWRRSCAGAPAPTCSGGVLRETGATCGGRPRRGGGDHGDRRRAARATPRSGGLRSAGMYTARWSDVVRRDLFGPSPTAGTVPTGSSSGWR